MQGECSDPQGIDEVDNESAANKENQLGGYLPAKQEEHYGIDTEEIESVAGGSHLDAGDSVDGEESGAGGRRQNDADIISEQVEERGAELRERMGIGTQKITLRLEDKFIDQVERKERQAGQRKPDDRFVQRGRSGAMRHGSRIHSGQISDGSSKKEPASAK